MKKHTKLICMLAAAAVVGTAIFIVSQKKDKADEKTDASQTTEVTVTPEATVEPTTTPETEVTPSVAPTITEESSTDQTEESQQPASDDAETTDSSTDSDKAVIVTGNEEFIDTEDGKKVNDICLKFAKAYLGANVKEMKKYLAKDAYVDDLGKAAKSVDYDTLAVYDYDVKKGSGNVSLPMFIDHEDSYTFLSMSYITENGEIKITEYGLEK